MARGVNTGGIYTNKQRGSDRDRPSQVKSIVPV